MQIKSIVVKGRDVWPFFVRSEEHPDPVVYLFEGTLESITKNFPRIRPVAVLPIAALDFDQVNIARYNMDVMNDTDLINLRPLDSTGHIWEVDNDDPLSIIDPVTGIEILRASDDQYAGNNAKVAAVAKDALSILQGIYYRLHSFHCIDMNEEVNRKLLDYLTKTLRKAGIQNVMDFDYEDQSK